MRLDHILTKVIDVEKSEQMHYNKCGVNCCQQKGAVNNI